MADTACLPQNDPFSLATGRIRPISELMAENARELRGVAWAAAGGRVGSNLNI
jgi:hypothetical protein